MNDLALYGGFIGFVLLMLFVDLKLFHTEAKEESIRRAAVWVSVWVGLAVAFGVIVYYWMGGERAAEYFAGYLIEYSLSVDNLFVFIVVFSYFKIPPEYRHRILFFGILGAIIFRGIFIAVGAALIHRFEFVIYIFGALLIFTAYRIARGSEEVHPEDNPVLKFFQRHFRTTNQFHEQKLVTRVAGKLVGTPLLVVLIVIETTDIVFAVDSIPAIFAITREPFIVLTSNVFAILGLRSLYFLLSSAIEKFHLLKYGLSVILAFVGVKMLLSSVVHIPIWLSLSVIVGVLTVTAVVSLAFPPKEKDELVPHPDDPEPRDLPR